MSNKPKSFKAKPQREANCKMCRRAHAGRCQYHPGQEQVTNCDKYKPCDKL